jgi:hypothetical protein
MAPHPRRSLRWRGSFRRSGARLTPAPDRARAVTSRSVGARAGLEATADLSYVPPSQSVGPSLPIAASTSTFGVVFADARHA